MYGYSNWLKKNTFFINKYHLIIIVYLHYCTAILQERSSFFPMSKVFCDLTNSADLLEPNKYILSNSVLRIQLYQHNTY